MRWPSGFVFGQSLTARDRTDFDLPGPGGDRQIGDRRVFGFAATRRNDRPVTCIDRQTHRFECLHKPSDLIQLDQDGVGDSFVDAARKALGIGDKQVVADELNPFLG